jgi:hypothetical protein
MATVARSRSSMPRTRLPAAAPLRTSRESRRVMPDHHLRTQHRTVSHNRSDSELRLSSRSMGRRSSCDRQGTSAWRPLPFTKLIALSIANKPFLRVGSMLAALLKPRGWNNNRGIGARRRRFTHLSSCRTGIAMRWQVLERNPYPLQTLRSENALWHYKIAA